MPGIVKDAVGGLFGSGKDAAKKAAQIQAQSVDKAIEFSRESRDLARGDLQPFRDAGASALPAVTQAATNYAAPELPSSPDIRALPTAPGAVKAPTATTTTAPTSKALTALIKDPNAQKAFITENPFYEALAKDATDRTMANAAARGKVGSGGTAAALQDRLLLLGQDLLDRNIDQRFRIKDMNFAQKLAANDQNFRQKMDSALAQSGINAQQFDQAMQSAITGGQMDAQKFEQELRRIGMTDDMINRNFSQLLNLATLGANAAAGQATATQQTASTISDLYTQQGNALAGGVIGGFNAQRGTANDLIKLAAGL